MSFRNDRFNEAMLSTDQFASTFDDPSEIAAFSDNGAGVDRLVNAIDRTDPSEVLTNLYTQKLHTAEMRLFRAGLIHLAPTLRLIAKYRGNRQESIWCIKKSNKVSRSTAKHLYFSHRKNLLKFFSPNKIRGSVEVRSV